MTTYIMSIYAFMNNALICLIQEAFFDPEFLSIVEYCRRGGSSPDGLMEMITEEKGSA